MNDACTYEAFHVNCPSAARERQIVLYPVHVYDTRTYLEKFYDKHFWRLFSSAFQWYRQFSRNFSFSVSKSTKRVISQEVYFYYYFLTLWIESWAFFTEERIFAKECPRCFLREIECERVDAPPFLRADCAPLVAYIITFYNL